MADEEIKRKRGRPRGKNRRPLKKWNPEKWEPVYDYIIVLSTTGKSNSEIGEITGYTKEHISNVLTSARGIAAKQEVIRITREKLSGTLEKRAETLADITLSRIHELLTDQEKFDAKPFQIIDRALAASRQFIKEKPTSPLDNNLPSGNINNGTINNIDKAIILTGPQVNQLTEGLKQLEEVKRLHAKSVSTD